MQFTLAYLKNNKQVLSRLFGVEKIEKGQISDIEDLKNTDIQGLIYDESDISDENRAFLSEGIKFYPIRKSEDLSISLEEFEHLKDAQGLFLKMSHPWLLANNISLLEELFKVLTHLKSLWPNERTTFFEELWFVIKNNIGAKSLKLIYNDIQVNQKEHGKNKLIRSVINGTKTPMPTPATEAEVLLMTHYEEHFQSPFEISEYNPHKGELIITANINNSPILIMAKVYQLSRLQKALLNTLFDGLQIN